MSTPVSARYAVPLALLCALALLPVARNVWAGHRSDDCAHPTALVPGTGIDDPEQRAAREREMREQFEAFAFREGIARGADSRTDLAWSIVRTGSAKRVYYRPEYWLSGHSEASAQSIDELEVDGRRLPVHRVQFAQRGGQVQLSRPTCSCTAASR